MRRAGDPLRSRGLPVPPVVAGLRGTDRYAWPPARRYAAPIRDRSVGHAVDLGSLSAPSEIVYKCFCSLTAHPPRTVPWPAAAPTGPSHAAAAGSAYPESHAAAGRGKRPTRPAPRRLGPRASSRCGWDTSPAPQQRTLLTIQRSVVGGEDGELVLRGARAPTRPLGNLRSGRRVPTSSTGPGSPIQVPRGSAVK